MTEPAPELLPIAAAFQAAAAARVQEADEAQQHADDVAAIKRAFRKGGSKMALSVGKAMGWHAREIEDLFRVPRPPSAATRDAAEEGGGGDDLPPSPPDDAGDTPSWKPERAPIKPLPDDCPVTPLGTLGSAYHYLNPLGEHVALTKHGADDLRSLFTARVDWLWSFHKKYNEKTMVQTGWKPDRTADSLIDACGKRGIFDPTNRLRGVGAWTDNAGQLVLHCGDAVWIHGEWRPPGYHGEHVYPGADKVPRPTDEPATGAPARELARLFQTWNFVDPGDDDGASAVDFAPGSAGGRLTAPDLILLGWVGGGLVCGATDWRSAVVLTGDAGTGKSFLQRLLGRVMGASLVQSSDATAAGVYQSVGFSSRAVAIDEAENDQNSAKMQNMVSLMRQASSGGLTLRGSNDHKFRGFTNRSSFFLSAIILPPFQSQDLTRITQLDLAPLGEATAPAIDDGKLGHLGRQLRRRILDGWPRWGATLERYRQQLITSYGFDARGADQLGNLLAMADLLLFDGEPDRDTVIELAALITRGRRPQRGDKVSNAEGMLQRLITMPVEAFRGGNRMTIGRLVEIAAGRGQREEPYTAGQCVEALRVHGIYVVGLMLEARVVLPNSHTGLATLLERSQWGTHSGAATSGWSQAMRRLPRARPENSRKLGGRGWSVPVGVFLRDDEEGAA